MNDKASATKAYQCARWGTCPDGHRSQCQHTEARSSWLTLHTEHICHCGRTSV